MKLVDAKIIKERRISYLRNFVDGLQISPTLVIIQVEGDEASNRYVTNKIKIGREIGVDVKLIKLPNNISQNALEKIISDQNKDEKVDGIILQLPLPKHLYSNKAINVIEPSKDVDGLTNVQFGKLSNREHDTFEPCTAQSVMSILNYVCGDLQGKDVVIVNRSHLIGLPLVHLLSQHDCTVTLCHSKTLGLKEKMKAADIIITGIGKAYYFNEEYFNDGQIIIDCSMNFIGNKLVGDVNYERLSHLDGYVSSGKGQTGPLTCVSLMQNTIMSCYRKKYQK